MVTITQDRKADAVSFAKCRNAEFADGGRGPSLVTLATLCRNALAGDAHNLASALADCKTEQDFGLIVDSARLWSACKAGVVRSGLAVPAFIEENARRERAQAMLANTRIMGLARLAFPALMRCNIAVIAFKGPFHQRQLHGDWFTRRSHDLDLLVRRAQFDEALNALEAIGFKARPETSQWWKFSLGEVHLDFPGGGVIDLHHRLQQPGCPAPRNLAEFIDAAEIELLGETPIAIPPLQHALLISALNFCKELFNRKPSARYAFDFAVGALRLSSQTHGEFTALVQRQGLEGPVGFTLAACQSLFGPLPGLPSLAVREAASQHWTERSDFARLVFEPESEDLCWPRRRSLLWQLCGGQATARCSLDFAAQAGHIAVAEFLRNAAPDSSPPDGHMSRSHSEGRRQTPSQTE
jgi:hypothetical protein